MTCKYFPPLYGLSFHFLVIAFEKDLLILITSTVSFLWIMFSTLCLKNIRVAQAQKCVPIFHCRWAIVL